MKLSTKQIAFLRLAAQARKARVRTASAPESAVPPQGDTSSRWFPGMHRFCSSLGRARPCQGRGSGIETRQNRQLPKRRVVPAK